MCGNAYNLQQGYLSNRFQNVSLDHYYSISSLIDIRISQGSLFGPLQFLIYMS